MEVRDLTTVVSSATVVEEGVIVWQQRENQQNLLQPWGILENNYGKNYFRIFNFFFLS